MSISIDGVKKYTAAQVELISTALEASQEPKRLRKEYEQKQEAERYARERDEKQRVAENQKLVREKALHAKDRIKGFLKAIEVAYEKDILKALQEIFREAHATLGMPLGKIYELMPDSEKPVDCNPNKVLCSACKNGQLEIVILFGEAGFNLNKTYGVSLPIEIAIKYGNYDVIRTMVELGADLHQSSYMEINRILFNTPSVLELMHYVAAMGVRDDIYISTLDDEHLRTAYTKGKVYFDEYQTALLGSLTIYFPQVLQTLILGYLGDKLSIPMKEVRVRRSPDQVAPLQGSQFRFLGKSVLKLNKKVNQQVQKLAQKFDYWMTMCHGHYGTDNEELIRWFKKHEGLDNYETFYNLAISLSQQGYATDPPHSEAEFNGGVYAKQV